LKAWRPEGDFSLVVSGLRNKLFGEFDQVNEQAYERLIEVYLSYGLTAEVHDLLSLNAGTNDSDQVSYYAEMASIMDGGSDPLVRGLSEFVNCDGLVALWAILALDDGVKSDDLNSDAALRALSELPASIREELAPRLSVKLRNHGMLDAASIAMRSLQRLQQPDTAVASLEELELRRSSVSASDVVDDLQNLATARHAESPSALIRYIDMKYENSGNISMEVATLAGAYAVEFRGSDLEPELQRSHVVALAKSKQFGEAFRVIEKMELGSPARKKATNAVYSILSSDADDVEFLERAFSAPSNVLENLSSPTRLELSDRLLELGFPDRVMEILAAREDGVPSRSELLLRGKVHLTLGNSRQAMAIANQYQDDDFLEFRRSISGDGTGGAVRQDPALVSANSSVLSTQAATEATLSGETAPETAGSVENRDASVVSSALSQSPPLRNARELADSAQALFDELDRVLAAGTPNTGG
jgi:hypothetical protein